MQEGKTYQWQMRGQEERFVVLEINIDKDTIKAVNEQQQIVFLNFKKTQSNFEVGLIAKV